MDCQRLLWITDTLDVLLSVLFQKRIKAAESESKLKQVYIPN